MKSSTQAVLCLVLACVVASASAGTTLWPTPQKQTFGSDTYTLDQSTFTMVSVGEDSVILTTALTRYMYVTFGGAIAADLTRTPSGALKGLKVNVKTTNVTLSLQTDETYTLVVEAPYATLTANTAFGALRGLETFAQSVYINTATTGFVVDETTVTDAPRFHHRGLMIDTSRHFQSLNTILENLDVMSYNKFNVLHWHIVDDESFPYNSSTFPNLALKGAYNPKNHVYQHSQIAEVIEYGYKLGIRVVPEFDTPGHTQAWGPGQPGLLTECYDDNKPDGTFGPVNPVPKSTWDFMSAFFKEVSEVFIDHYIHLGGDEVSFDCWASNPGIQAWMKEHGYTNYADLEQYYESTLLGIVNDLDKGYVVWQEIFDNGIKVRPDTVIDVWKGGWQKELASVTSTGLRAILSTPWYLNYISYGEDWPKYYTVEPLNFTGTEEQKKLVMGGEVCLWAEFIDATNFMSRAWPRASAVGERLWSAGSVNNVTEATPRLHDFRCKLIKRGVNAEPPSGPSYCDTEYVPLYQPPWAGGSRRL